MYEFHNVMTLLILFSTSKLVWNDTFNFVAIIFVCSPPLKIGRKALRLHSVEEDSGFAHNFALLHVLD